ncbi:uncharacterized protein LOC100384342 [Zea mays]|uniref:Uncharacterized protein n=1 Tax=Zea mays TaxID=4577 RepID=C0PNJ4_MAIZE|nr:uncharacterized protein LOC100384342 [Zea mays]ACN36760.1 unknown [Zea mays]|eukprot:NP_001170364.1 uncharacterized protein LOC100384342 [Zea mays]
MLFAPTAAPPQVHKQPQKTGVAFQLASEPAVRKEDNSSQHLRENVKPSALEPTYMEESQAKRDDDEPSDITYSRAVDEQADRMHNLKVSFPFALHGACILLFNVEAVKIFK